MDGPTPDAATSLYERDLYAWAMEQAAALRDAAAGRQAALDWENLAEEIESLGKSDRRELSDRLQTLAEHLLKLEFAENPEPRAGWRNTVARTRSAVAKLLEQSPCLRRQVPDLAERAFPSALRLARQALQYHDDFLLPRTPEPYTPEQLLSDWWPPTPPG